MKRRLKIFGVVISGTSIVAVLFFGVLSILNAMDERSRDAQRAEHVRLIKAALERYHDTRGTYPQFPYNFVDDLKQALVYGGYLKGVPHDPLPDRAYIYTTSGAEDGQRYGLKISLERSGECLTGVGTSGSNWWGGKLPACPF
jgi:hypothetical protein